jgi:outer membrane autotransporter protein
MLERRFAEWSAGKKRSALIAAALLGLVCTAESVNAACTGPAILSVVSGNNQSVTPGSSLPLPLMVMVRCPGTPPTEAVTWSIVSGEGTLGATTTLAPLSLVSPSDVSGTTSNTLTLTGQSTVVVTATASGSTVSFTATPAALPPILPAASAQAGQAAGAASQGATLGSLAVLNSNVLTTPLGLRLQALRQGARGLSVTGLPPKLAAPLEIHDVTGSPSALTQASGLESSLPSPLSVFVNALGSFGNQDTTSRELGFDFHSVGGTLGVDYRFTDRFILGLAGSFLQTRLDLGASSGDTQADAYSLSVYTNYYIVEELYVDGIATLGWTKYHTERDNTDGNGTARASTDGPQVSFSVGTGYNFNVGPLTFGPVGRMDYIRVHIDGYHETGAGSSNARVGSQTIESLTVNLGGQAMYTISTAWGALSPFARAEWVHELMGDSRNVTGAVGSAAVTLQTNTPDRNYVNLGLGASATFPRGISAFLDYDVVAGRANFISHSFTGGLRIEF